jgi:hypothetical protein
VAHGFSAVMSEGFGDARSIVRYVTESAPYASHSRK